MSSFRHTIPSLQSFNVDSFMLRQKCGKTQLSGQNYEAALNIAKEMRKEGLEISDKIRSIEELAKTKRKQQDIQKHKRLWMEAAEKLDRQSAKLSEDIHDILATICLDKDYSIDDAEFVCELLDSEQKQELLLEDLQREFMEDYSKAQAFLKKAETAGASQEPQVMEQFDAFIKYRMPEIYQTIDKLDHEILQISESRFSNLPQRLELEDLDAIGWVTDTESMPIHITDMQCADPEVQSDCLSQWNSFDDQYYQQALALQQDFRRFSDTDQPHDGWSDRDHSRFVKLLNEYQTVCVNRFEKWMDRAKMELQKSAAEISKHYHYYIRYQHYIKQKHALLRTHKKQKKEFLKLICETFRQCNQVYKNNLEQVQAAEERVRWMDERNRKLKEWRERKLEQIRQSEAEIMILTQMEYLKKEKSEKKRRQRVQAEKQIISAYRKAEAEKRMEERQKMNELKQLMEIQKAHEREENAARISQRYEMLEQRKDEERHLVEAKKMNRERLERRLEKLREAVRSRIAVERDPNRLIAPTASYSNSISNSDAGPTEKVQMFGICGYTDKQIMKDQRTKLLHALSHSGSQLSAKSRSYMVSLMKSMPGIKRYANDWKSQIVLNQQT